MVIWSGFGFLAGLIPVAVFMLTALAMDRGNHTTVDAVIASLISAALVYGIGRRLNGAPARELVDPQTGQRVRLRRRHPLFWIPMEWWAIPCLMIGAGVVVSLFNGAQ